MHREDELLIEKAKEDPREYEKLYRKYRDRVFNHFWYRVGHVKELAEDFTQETFLRAFKHLKSFVHREYAYLAYLLRIARNILVDHYRKPAAARLEAADDVPYEMLEEAERASEAVSLWRAVQELPARSRDILLMKYQEGMPVRDIAKAMGTTENAVKLALSRARKRLAGHPSLSHLGRFRQAGRSYKAPKFLKEPR